MALQIEDEKLQVPLNKKMVTGKHPGPVAPPSADRVRLWNEIIDLNLEYF